MWRVFSSISLVILLSGCATQFGTKIEHPIHHKMPVAAPVASVPPAVIVAAPVVAPKPTLKQRILSKFFRKRAAK